MPQHNERDKIYVMRLRATTVFDATVCSGRAPTKKGYMRPEVFLLSSEASTPGGMIMAEVKYKPGQRIATRPSRETILLTGIL